MLARSATPRTTSAPPLESLEAGTLLAGRYRIDGLVGRGGMGEVYRAEDMRLGQTVALKLLPPHLAADRDRLDLFHREVRTARQVTHPNVTRVYDIVEADGHLFLTMEFVDGEDLARVLKRDGGFVEGMGVELLRQICGGLAAIHDAGVLHRDLKPANVMLDRSGRVHLMDFGLASTGTAVRSVGGTPGYMAPEQIVEHQTSRASDIYAWPGAVRDLHRPAGSDSGDDERARRRIQITNDRARERPGA
jgi:serine/threonine protein kinase